MNEAGLVISFLAGAASFLSPCVLPLVPGYLSYMSGMSIESVHAGTVPVKRLLGPVLLFVAGFSTIFVLLGTTASFIVGQFLRFNQHITTRVAGALIIVMGLAFLGVIPIPWMRGEHRFDMRKAKNVAGNYAMGAAFGFGWSPCIGPTLGVALGLAASESTAGRGALMLFVYSLGLGVPFVLSAIGVSRLVGAFSWLRKHQLAVLRVSGTLLIGFGLLMIFGRVFVLSSWLQRAMEAAGLEKLVGI